MLDYAIGEVLNWNRTATLRLHDHLRHSLVALFLDHRRTLYRRGLEGRALQLILSDGCAGLAAAIRTVYPRVRHQRCWVHKMRNILEKARKCDYDELKIGAQAIYRAESRTQAEAAFRRFRARWQRSYPGVVKRPSRAFRRRAAPPSDPTRMSAFLNFAAPEAYPSTSAMRPTPVAASRRYVP